MGRPARRAFAAAGLFDRIAVSDLAWARGLPFRAGLADLWPFEAKVLRVAARAPTPRCSWLRSRLKKDAKLPPRRARELRSAEIDGMPVRIRRRHMRSPSDLLSDELEVFTRDPIYEAAVRSV